MEPELIADRECEVGEGPLWHPDEKALYWVDIYAGQLFRYDPVVDTHERWYERDGVIGGFTIQADGSLLLFEDGGRVEIVAHGRTETILDGVDGEETSRFNDVIADPRGGVFCGTMPTDDALGSLYRLDTRGRVTKLVDGVDTSNGLGFSFDRKHLYYTESRAKTIYRFRYDGETGAIGDREIFVDSTDEPGVPDGMTVDADGYVWSARWNGSCVIRYDPTGAEVGRVSFPVRKVTSITFGGDDYRHAFVTTALGRDGTRAKEGAGAGSLFRIDLGVRGVPEFRSEIKPDAG